MSETYLPSNIDPTYWDAQGECRNYDPDIFFPEEKGQARRNSVNSVISTICAVCTVSNQCLAYALSAGELEIWGGTDGRMRDAAKRHAATLVKKLDKAEEDSSEAANTDNAPKNEGTAYPSGVKDERILAHAYEKALELRMKRYGF